MMIEVHELSKRFGPTLAVNELSFAVGSGQVTGFLGPNGAGKTTTLRMLLGLITPTAGTATIAGHPYRNLPDPLHTVGAWLEGSSCHPGRTARNHLRLHALAGHGTPARVDEVLDLVDLTGAADRRVGTYSLGMRQRLGLATALLHRPQVLVLDEPANGLDPEGVRWLRELLRGLATDGVTILVSSHILAEVAQTADSVVILDRGRLVTYTSLTQLLAGPAQSVRVRTPARDLLRDLLTADGATVTATDTDWLAVTGSTPERIGTVAATHAIPVYETTVGSANLEDVFFRLTGQAAPRKAT